MNKEEILKNAQDQPVSEYEDHTIRKAYFKASFIIIFIAGLMFFIEMLVFKKLDFGKPFLILLFDLLINFFEGRKRNGIKQMIEQIFMFCGAVICLILYIGALFR